MNDNQSAIVYPKLTAVQERAAKLIAGGMGQATVARKVGKTKQTINRWCNQNKVFIDRVLELRTDYQKDADDTLLKAVPDAAKTVVKIANGEARFDDTKELTATLKAALYILDLAKKGGLPRHTADTERGSQPTVKPELATDAAGIGDEEAQELLDR
jgi:DNA-binding XRE family transcriptional regulator